MNGQKTQTHEAKKGQTTKGESDKAETKEGEDFGRKHGNEAGGDAAGPGGTTCEKAGKVSGRRRDRKADAQRKAVETSKIEARKKIEGQIETLNKKLSLV